MTLRLAGRVIGRGTRLGQDGLTVWGATREALLEADAALPFERDALREAHVRDAAASVTLDLELAGPLTPVLGESDEAIASSFSPGHHGVAGRVGATLEAVFPGLLLSTGAGGGEGARIVAGRLGLPPRPLRDLTRDGGLTLYRFETRRLAQERGGAEPVFLYRGGRVVGVGEVTIDRLRRAADEAAEHLMARRWKGEEPHGLLGDYNPVLDRYDPVIAPALAQASAALALARYASVPGAPASRADRATEFAAGLLAGLTRVSTAEEDPLADPLSAAMWLVAREALRAAS
ncbi:MAG TPA: hypothetical protein DEB06_04260, partial [Phycisphaerales bacterium]|nr:hypothetical protein [Phycisphaerales bacterium]